MYKTVSLSLSQERLLFLNETLPNKALYNIPMVFSLKGKLDIKCLEKAFELLINRHEILRFRFKKIGDQLEGVIFEKPHINFNIKDFRRNGSDKDVSKALEYITAKTIEEFDLFQDFLIRVELAIVKENEFILAIIMHHTISDEWSEIVLINELIALYQSIQDNIELNLPKLSITYQDYASWHRHLVNNHYLDRELEYWQEYLQGAAPMSILPVNKIRPLELSYQGGCKKIEFSAQELLKIKKYCKTQKVTIFTFLLAAFKLLLHSYTGEDDLVIGFPSANRLQKELENLVGLFVNVIPIRTSFYGKIKFRDFLDQIKLNLINCYHNQNFPFDRLVQRLGLKREQNFHPIFQILFATIDKFLPKKISDELFIEKIDLDGKLSKFDLSVFCEEKNNLLMIKFTYSKDLYDFLTIKKISESFKLIVQAIINNDDFTVSEIELLTDLEKSKQLKPYDNLKGNIDPQDETLHSAFKAAAIKSPDKLALIVNDNYYTYKTLDNLSDKFASYLETLSFQSNKIIAVCMDPSLEFIVTILGILKSSGTYLPIDVRYPQERVNYMLEEASPQLIVTRTNYLSKFSTKKSEVINLDMVWNEIKYLNNPHKLRTDNKIACIIYTSGSTGNPKGVLCKHSSIMNRIQWVHKQYPFKKDEVFILLANLSFVDSIGEIFIPLIGMASLLIPESLHSLSPELLIYYMDQYRITRIGLPPSLLKVLIEEYKEQLLTIKSLKHIEVSGEMFSEALALKTLSVFKNAKFINRYGSTEATSIIYNEISSLREESGKLEVKSNVISNTKIYILNKYLKLMPAGFVGEVYINGRSLAAGYLNDEVLTKEKFVKITFSQDRMDLLYKTGDLGLITEEGVINIVGRKDSQIKLNSYRIEPREIEKLLEKHPSVIDSKVIVGPHNDDFKRLIAYLILKKDKIGPDNYEYELRSYLENYLPEFMIPSKFISLDQFPMTINNKIDYQKLIDIEFASSSQGILSTDYIVPRNHLEYQMGMLWCQVLKLESISINDNFFEIGGNSIIALMLIAKMQTKFQIKFPTAHIYKYPTISLMVKSIKKDIANIHGDILLPIKITSSSSPPLFLIHPARGIAFDYLILSKYINEFSIYGINDPGLMNSSNAFNSIEQMADYYIKTILEVQKNGPYRLGGWSFGGQVAIEMARQLTNKNYEVESVILFDSTNYPKEYLQKVTVEEINNGLAAIGFDILSYEAALLRNQDINAIKLIKNYIPKAYHGRTILIKSQEEEFPKNDKKEELRNLYRIKDVYQGWMKLVGRNLEIYSISGTHNDIFNPKFVKNVVEVIKRVMEGSSSSKILHDLSLSVDDAYLHHSIESNDNFMLKRMLELNANLSSRDSNGVTAYQKIVLQGDNTKIDICKNFSSTRTGVKNEAFFRRMEYQKK